MLGNCSWVCALTPGRWGRFMQHASHTHTHTHTHTHLLSTRAGQNECILASCFTPRDRRSAWCATTSMRVCVALGVRAWIWSLSPAVVRQTTITANLTVDTGGLLLVTFTNANVLGLLSGKPQSYRVYRAIEYIYIYIYILYSGLYQLVVQSTG